MGATRRVTRDFRAARKEMRGTCNRGLPRFIQTLRTLLYDKPPNLSQKVFEQQCAVWVPNEAVKACSICQIPFSGKVTALLSGSGKDSSLRILVSFPYFLLIS